MMRTSAKRRPAFTLLEVLLASTIALFLLGGLYVAMQVTLTRAQISREQSAMSNLSRAVINRITTDLSQSLGPLQPKSGADGGTYSSGSTTTTTDPSSTTSSESTTGTGTESSESGTTSTEPATTDGMLTTDANLPFSAGVIGTSNQVTIFMTRVPTGLTDPEAMLSPETLFPADQRRITYYLGSTGGLCRQERPWVTADGVGNVIDPDYSTQELDLIALEVVDIFFEYFDGGVWLSEWDGTQPGLDGVSISGPPRAIRVTMTLLLPGENGTQIQRRVQHVIAVRSANGAYIPPETATATAGGM